MVYVEIDALFSLLLPGSNRSRGDRMLAYNAAHAVARTLLELGLIPVLECTYSRIDQRASLAAAIEDLPGAELWVVEFYVSPEDAVTRFRQRDQETDLDDELLRQRVASFPYFDQALRIDSSQLTPDDLADTVRCWLDEGPVPTPIKAWVQAANGWDVP